jgi:peptidoglycan/xylan/chitin deacetylase (PgdA/CDA1 family)
MAFYGAVLMSALLGTTAISLRSRGTAPGTASAALPAPAVQVSTATTAPTSTTTRTPTHTASPSPTGSLAASTTATFTPTETVTPSPTATLTPTYTPSPTPTFTPSVTPTTTYTPTPYPTPGPGAGNRKLCVPILTYHHIGPLPAGANNLRRGLNTSPELFEQHLAYFRDNGIATISLDDLVYAIALGWPLPEKRVIITIDDGYSDVYEYAFPLLKEYGATATLFIPTSFIDNAAPGYMTWPQIEEMSRAGIDVQPHTKDHVDLRRQRRAYLVYQILGSKQTVEAHTGQVARYFAYPAGEYDDNVIELLKEMNFWAAVATDSGVTHSLDRMYTLRRMRVSESIDIESMMVYMNFCGWK